MARKVAIKTVMHPFNRSLQQQAEKRRKVIRRMLKNRTLQDVAAELGITHQRVSQIAGPRGNNGTKKQAD